MTMGRKGIGFLVAGLAGQPPPTSMGPLIDIEDLNNKQLLMAPEVNTEIPLTQAKKYGRRKAQGHYLPEGMKDKSW